MLSETSRKRVEQVYEISKPYAYSTISFDPLTNQYWYEVIEPTLTEEEKEHIKRIKDHLYEMLDITLQELGSEEKAINYLKAKIQEVIKHFKIPVKKESLDKINYYLVRDLIGYGKIDVMMKDPMIEDISCNGKGIPIYIWHRLYESIPSNVTFNDDEELDSFIIRLAYRSGRMISMAKPMLDASLPDGSRIQLTLGTHVTKHGSTFTIRKFKADPITIVDLINFNTISSEMAALLWYLIENRYGIFVCGGVASGKTTMLNALSSFIKPDYKIITIEDTPEIQLYHKNWLRSVTRPSAGAATAEITLFDLLKAALRQRPDYIIVGEIRGEEAYTLFQAMATGHLGMATMHAESVASAIHRLENPPMNIPRTLLSHLSLITVQARLEREGRPVRRTITLTEIIGIDPTSNEILTNEIYRYDPKTDTFRYSGRCYTLESLMKRYAIPPQEAKRQIQMRKELLDWLARTGKRSFKEVTEYIRNFIMNPEEVYRVIQI
ncbi:Putative conjugal transfer protein [archaeon HR06]|nr:Putative conjugal transfer protein [archaeon HR06]